MKEIQNGNIRGTIVETDHMVSQKKNLHMPTFLKNSKGNPYRLNKNLLHDVLRRRYTATSW